jgi:hypothetical protein
MPARIWVECAPSGVPTVRRACAFFLELLMAIVEGLWANQEVEPLQVEPIHWIAVGLQTYSHRRSCGTAHSAEYTLRPALSLSHTHTLARASMRGRAMLDPVPRATCRAADQTLP